MAEIQRDLDDGAGSTSATLPDGLRARMEQAYSFDFSSVRIHADSTAHHVTSMLDAHALTAGTDIWFGSGAYLPGTSTGDQLIAHELAHVVQQSHGLVRAPVDSGPSDPLEVAATAAADMAVRAREPARVGLANRPTEVEAGGAATVTVPGAWSPPGAAQRLAGTRQSFDVKGPPTAVANLQRFVGTEHKQLGDTTGIGIDLGNGVVLTWGDVVALAGDEYGSADELLADTKTEAGKQRLLAAFRHDNIPDPVGSRMPEPTEEQRSARFLTYLQLAADNASHFNADGGAITRWTADHTTAIIAAMDAGLTMNVAGYQVARAREAFAQHFLTDSFSGGHIRTPRADIISWYRTNFGPPVVDHLIEQLTGRLIDGLVAQIKPQTNWPESVVRWKVKKVVGKRLAEAIAAMGGRARLNDFVALGVAGIVSGAMHDLEGKRGVAVSSEAHPEPWTAFGDAQLADSPVSKAQAELAVAAATAHVNLAYDIGRAHGIAGDVASRPTVSYFGFDSSAITSATADQLSTAATYLHVHPEVRVTLTGHTDPTGSDAYNDDLGLRRAEAVAVRLRAAGLNADQVEVRSQGRRQLATTAPGQFRLNRRVTFAYVSRPGPYRDLARDAALADLTAKVGPPFPDVTRYVPHPLAVQSATTGPNQSTTATSQVELENWRWGNIPPTLRSAINAWVVGYGPTLSNSIASAHALDDQSVDGYNISPRPIVETIVRELLRDPSDFLETALGRPMSSGQP